MEQVKLLKGHLWELSFHPISYWKEMKKPPNPVPLFSLWNKRKFEKEFIKDDVKYEAIGIYFFPFVIRFFIKK